MWLFLSPHLIFSLFLYVPNNVHIFLFICLLLLFVLLFLQTKCYIILCCSLFFLIVLIVIVVLVYQQLNSILPEDGWFFIFEKKSCHILFILFVSVFIFIIFFHFFIFLYVLYNVHLPSKCLARVFEVKCLCSRGQEWQREGCHSHQLFNNWFLGHEELTI